MSNARSQLRNIIDSGRSIAIDCYAIGRTIDAKDKIGRLFKTEVMNKTVVFKRFQSNSGKRKDGPNSIDTTVYFPLDFDKAYDGGESVALGEPTFQKTLALKISNGAASKEMMKHIACLASAPIGDWQSAKVSFSLTLKFRWPFFTEGFLTLDVVFTEITGFDGCITGGNVPFIRVLDQFVYGYLCCSDRKWGILCDLRSIACDKFIEFVCGYDMVDPANHFCFFGRVIAP